MAAAVEAQKGWAALSGHTRARHLYSIARHLQVKLISPNLPITLSLNPLNLCLRNIIGCSRWLTRWTTARRFGYLPCQCVIHSQLSYITNPYKSSACMHQSSFIHRLSSVHILPSPKSARNHAINHSPQIRETRDVDTPLAVRHFYHHAGWAQLLDRELPDWKPVGCDVCVCVCVCVRERERVSMCV